jgi:hypothetical protein
MSEKIKAGQKWNHKTNKQPYVIDSVGIFKLGNDDWIECVTYRGLVIPDRFYTRIESDFLDKFEPYDNC